MKTSFLFFINILYHLVTGPCYRLLRLFYTRTSEVNRQFVGCSPRHSCCLLERNPSCPIFIPSIQTSVSLPQLYCRRNCIVAVICSNIHRTISRRSTKCQRRSCLWYFSRASCLCHNCQQHNKCKCHCCYSFHSFTSLLKIFQKNHLLNFVSILYNEGRRRFWTPDFNFFEKFYFSCRVTLSASEINWFSSIQADKLNRTSVSGSVQTSVFALSSVSSR